MTLRWTPWAVAAGLLAGCGGGGGGAPAPEAQQAVPLPVRVSVPVVTAAPNAPVPTVPPAAPEPGQPPAACSLAGQQLSVRAYMEDNYYWHGQLAAGEPAAATLDAYFRSLLLKPLDRYSYTESTAAFNQVFTLGSRVGYGYTLVWSNATQTQLRVRTVEPLSPVGLAGLRRGDTVLSIDGFTPAQIAAGQPRPVSDPGVPRTLRVRDVGGAERTLSVTSAAYTISPVLATNTFDVQRGGAPVKVGYLAYQQFVGYSRQALGVAFQSFADARVQELVLDLRYNGGGSVTVARDIAAMIGASRTAAHLFAYLRFNTRHPENNLSIVFGSDTLPAPPLPGLSRLVVLTSRETASASELLVNGLRPFMEVVLVGDTTYGKPYGFVPKDFCGTTVNAVNFESLNADGVGGFTSGIAATCPAPDDLDRQLGDPQEGRTRAALYYIANGRCEGAAPQSAGALVSPPALGETVSPRMFVD